MDTEFLHFEEVENRSGTTKKFCVMNKNSLVVLGEIRWYGPWRQYCFHTENSIFDRKCMKEVIKFIDKLMEERKK